MARQLLGPLLLLIHVDLLQILVELFGAHLPTTVIHWLHVGSLESLDVKLVLESTQLILVKVWIALGVSFGVWELLSFNLVQKVSILSRHVALLSIHSERVGTQAWTIISEVATLVEKHITICTQCILLIYRRQATLQ